jgi:hypothetical protein
MQSKETTRRERERIIANLEALVSALDRRVPHIERHGEATIAREAAALKGKALERLTELRAETD